jgi:hypothetical protein
VTTYYVDPVSGNDSNPGTEANPWRTVSKAATSMAPGDKAIYEDGTYDIGATQDAWVSGSAGGGYITHEARNKHLAIWQQTSYSGNYAISVSGKSYLEFVGVSVQQATITNKNCTFEIENSDRIELTRVEITNCTNHCLILRGGNSNITIDDCDIHSEDSASVSSGKDGIHINLQNNSAIVIKNNRIYHTQHNGVGNSNTSIANCDVLIQNNDIYEIDSHGVSLDDIDATIEYNRIRGAGTWPLDDNDSNGIRLLRDVDAVVRFNDISGCSGRALWVSVTSGTVEFVHNSCYGNNYNPLLDDQGHIQFRSDGPPTTLSLTFKNNIIYKTVADRRCLKSDIGEAYISAMDYNVWYDDSESDTYMRRNGTTYSSISNYLASFESNSIEDNPDFVDPGNQDFELQAGSPAIDAGDDLGYPYNGSAPDIGAHESGDLAVSVSESITVGDNLSVSLAGAPPSGALEVSVSETVNVADDASAYMLGTFPIRFETGDLSEFDSVVPDGTDLSAAVAAAREGSYGMQAVLDDATSIYGYKAFGNKSEMRIGFWFNPNGFDLVDNIVICGGGSSIGASDFRIRLRYYATPQLVVYAGATNNLGTYDYTSEVNISDDWHWIEVHMKRSTGPGDNNGFVKLWIDVVDGTPDAQLTGREDDEKDFDDICLGAGSVPTLIDETIYFDYLMVNDTGDVIGVPGQEVQVSESITVSDSVFVSLSVPPALSVSVSDTVAVSDEVTSFIPGVSALMVDVNESITVTDAVMVYTPVDLAVSVSESIAVADTLTVYQIGSFPLRFETGDLSEFDDVTADGGDLSAAAGAAREGSYGLQAVLDDATAIYGHKTYQNKSEIRIGFWFNPNGFDLVDNIIICGGGTIIGSSDFRIRLKYYATPQLVVYAGATNDVGTYDYTSEVNISDDWHWIEVHMKRSTGPGADDGFIKLWVDVVDGTPDAQLTGRDDDTRDFDDICWGAGSLTAPISETIYFDYLMANDTGDAIGVPKIEVSVSESVSVSDAVSVSVGVPSALSVSVSDAITVSDYAVADFPSSTALNVRTSDTVGVADTVAAFSPIILSVSVSDAVGVSDTVLAQIPLDLIVWYIDGAHMVVDGAHAVVGT